MVISCEPVTVIRGKNGTPHTNYILTVGTCQIKLEHAELKHAYSEIRSSLFPDCPGPGFLKALKGEAKLPYVDAALKQITTYCIRMEEYELAAGLQALKAELAEFRQWRQEQASK